MMPLIFLQCIDPLQNIFIEEGIISQQYPPIIE